MEVLNKNHKKCNCFWFCECCLDITLLNIRKNINGILSYEIDALNEYDHLGGRIFDNKLIEYCLKQFCLETGNKEENVRKDKRAYKRLKTKCEKAKELLIFSKEEAIIYIDNYFGKNNLCIKITRDKFDQLCKDIYDKIKELILGFLDDIPKNINDIDDIILVGNSARISGVRNCLKTLFGEEKIKDYLNPEEVVCYGATIEASKMEKEDKANYDLKDINEYNLGIEIINPDVNDAKKNGNLLYTIIKKHSKIPSFNEGKFRCETNKDFPKILINIYEGNDKYINKNKYLGKICIDNLVNLEFLIIM